MGGVGFWRTMASTGAGEVGAGAFPTGACFASDDAVESWRGRLEGREVVLGLETLVKWLEKQCYGVGALAGRDAVSVCSQEKEVQAAGPCAERRWNGKR